MCPCHLLSRGPPQRGGRMLVGARSRAQNPQGLSPCASGEPWSRGRGVTCLQISSVSLLSGEATTRSMFCKCCRQLHHEGAQFQGCGSGPTAPLGVPVSGLASWPSSSPSLSTPCLSQRPSLQGDGSPSCISSAGGRAAYPQNPPGERAPNPPQPPRPAAQLSRWGNSSSRAGQRPVSMEKKRLVLLLNFSLKRELLFPNLLLIFYCEPRESNDIRSFSLFATQEP